MSFENAILKSWITKGGKEFEFAYLNNPNVRSIVDFAVRRHAPTDEMLWSLVKQICEDNIRLTAMVREAIRCGYNANDGRRGAE